MMNSPRFRSPEQIRMNHDSIHPLEIYPTLSDQLFILKLKRKFRNENRVDLPYFLHRSFLEY
jgi:hypothetical protein